MIVYKQCIIHLISGNTEPSQGITYDTGFISCCCFRRKKYAKLIKTTPNKIRKTVRSSPLHLQPWQQRFLSITVTVFFDGLSSAEAMRPSFNVFRASSPKSLLFIGGELCIFHNRVLFILITLYNHLKHFISFVK